MSATTTAPVCRRCNGRGILPAFRHVENGICFACGGRSAPELRPAGDGNDDERWHPTDEPVLPSEDLHYHPDTRTFTQETSQFRHVFGFVPPAVLGVRSARTGAVAEFRLSRRERDTDGDVQAWVYHNAAHGMCLILYND